ncbi:hypothetical protein [Levilactobacillus bambusae]|uniref:Uncharacterized protein n=1 Tax=Levilactobacillus bambusae TaxID=2024736 RepID=A0A2V1MZR4_9LACO|nr:hypothetical protein [Levilactobacillus bambusae]PWG00511.1 hypothetical protein DCM90_06200 [Levilactobacillus bambusae]
MKKFRIGLFVVAGFILGMLPLPVSEGQTFGNWITVIQPGRGETTLHNHKGRVSVNPPEDQPKHDTGHVPTHDVNQ